jgi:hypothetical protein
MLLAREIKSGKQRLRIPEIAEENSPRPGESGHQSLAIGGVENAEG